MKWCEVCDPSSCPVTRVDPDGLYWLNTATPADLMEVERIDQSKDVPYCDFEIVIMRGDSGLFELINCPGVMKRERLW